ncbi:MAG: hypothetical protein K8R59_04575 [Thermoanaerobaculales bacterium]|nr:hypothetical protein [Thermoanaerobaculales bacterium]
MAYGLRAFVAAVLLCSPAFTWAADRLAVLETFGNPAGAYCSAAGPALISLQSELEGEAVLLEYNYSWVADKRLTRFWATGVSAPYLPLVMVGSGHSTSSGPVDYKNEYSGMIQNELARPPRADITAYWRRLDNFMRAYVTVHNTSGADLLVDEDATVWLILYEKAAIGVSNTWVRSTASWSLESDLAPGETVTTMITTTGGTVADWNRVAGLVLVDNSPAGHSRYDMVQATEVVPASLTVIPEELPLTPNSPTAEFTLQGPHVLEWTATTNVPWLEVVPATGTLPSTVTVILIPELRRPMETSATVSIDAAGDSMSFHEQVEVKVGARARRAAGRAHPNG